MNLIGSLIIAFSMYSKIPMPQIDWTKERMRYPLCFFPLIGVVIGVVLIGFSKLSIWLSLTTMSRACFATVIPLLITGGIHMDGFLDVIDAKSSYQSTEKKLEILKDPHTGAFAIIGYGIYLFLYAGAFAELPDEGVNLFAAVFVMTRAYSGLSVVWFPKAKNSGLAAAFANQADRLVVGVMMAVYLCGAILYLCLFGSLTIGISCTVAASILLGIYDRMSRKEFGGITGDLAGYFLQSCELMLLFVLVILLK